MISTCLLNISSNNGSRIKTKIFRHGQTYCYNFFSIWVFLSRTLMIHRAAGEEGDYLFNSSLPLQPDSQTPRHQPGNYCRELTSAHSQKPDSNQELLVSERKSLTTKLCALLTIVTIVDGKIRQVLKSVKAHLANLSSRSCNNFSRKCFRAVNKKRRS